MLELTMYNVMKHYGENCILNNAAFTAYEGDKIGLVGSNGSGKSTILKILAGIEPIDTDYRKVSEGKSRISYPKGTTFAYLDQSPCYPADFKVIDILNLAFRELDAMEEQMKMLEGEMAQLNECELETAFSRYNRLQQTFDARGGYQRAERLNKVCSGLKFDGSFLQKEFGLLSGGEKTIVNLAKVLLENPDVLLLDEPTNHLDMETAEWLEKYIGNCRGIVIIVSHDRYFLDKTASKIVEVENRQCGTYNGNYSEYVRQKEESMLLQYEKYREQKKMISSMQNAVKDLRDWAARSDNNKFFRRAVSIQRKLDKIERVHMPRFEKRSMNISFKATQRSGFEIIKILGLSKSFGDRMIFNEAGLFITLGERVAFLGPNGSGKTTFLKILLGEIKPDKGAAMLGANVKTAYLPQIITFNNDEDTVIGCFRENRIISEGKAREYLSKFMFYGRDTFKKVRQLSGGEKVRLKLAMLLFEEINLLILDEPTNHLDIDSIEVLEEALEDFEGTILFVSHDRYFINKVCSRSIALEAGKLVSYEGNYDFYKNKRNEQPQLEEAPKQLEKAKPERNNASKDNRNTGLEISRLESGIKFLEEELRKVEENMLLPGLNHEELYVLFNRKEELNAKLEELLGMWMDINNGREIW